MLRITHSGSSHATACTFESLLISSLGTGVFFIFKKSEMRLRSKRGTHRLIIPPLGGGEFGAAVTHFAAFHGLLPALYGCWHVNGRHFLFSPCSTDFGKKNSQFCSFFLRMRPFTFFFPLLHYVFRACVFICTKYALEYVGRGGWGEGHVLDVVHL